MQVVKEMKQKLENFVLPRGFAIIPVLIHVNGVNDIVIDSDYFYVIDFGEMI